MAGWIIWFCIPVWLVLGAERAVPKDDFGKAEALCASPAAKSRRVRNRAGGPNISDGFSESCAILQEVKTASESDVFKEPSQTAKLAELRNHIAQHILSGETPALADAKKYCAYRRSNAMHPKVGVPQGLITEAEDAMRVACESLQSSLDHVEKKTQESPRPTSYYSARVAVRISVQAVVVSEENYRRLER